MRTIDADALLQHKRKMSGADFGGEFWDEAVLVSDIENAPTIDAVEVVRCKDCRYWDDDRRCNGIKNGLVVDYTDEDDFCSYGERRSDV